MTVALASYNQNIRMKISLVFEQWRIPMQKKVFEAAEIL